MALVRSIQPMSKQRQSLHAVVECTVTVFTDRDGKRYLQLDTHGSSDRQLKGKVSQSIQLGEESAAQLKRLIGDTFPALR